MAKPKVELSETPEERRALLNSLASRHEKLDKDEIKLHDRLAAQVAKDEDSNG